MNGKFKDYIADPVQAAAAMRDEGCKLLPRLEEGTVIDKPCFVTDIDGDCWWIDPQARLVERCSQRDDN